MELIAGVYAPVYAYFIQFSMYCIKQEIISEKQT